jgi:catechol 2,3-dioxygenase-like lactoylglutathione lyase family enzyme
MLHYITLGTNNLARAKKFYDPVLATLGMTCSMADQSEIGYGMANPALGQRERFLYIVTPVLEYPATWGNGTMIALTANTRADVDAFHAAAIANGGKDDGAPGLRPYHASFYACYVRDPDGNKLSAVCETPVA